MESAITGQTFCENYVGALSLVGRQKMCGRTKFTRNYSPNLSLSCLCLCVQVSDLKVLPQPSKQQ